MPPYSHAFFLIAAKVKSYEGVNSTGSVQITGGDLGSLEGNNVLVVEDIIDTGERSSNDFAAHACRGRRRQRPLHKRDPDLTCTLLAADERSCRYCFRIEIVSIANFQFSKANADALFGNPVGLFLSLLLTGIPSGQTLPLIMSSDRSELPVG